MTNPLIDTQALRVLEERLAVLWGSRGNPLDAALRRRQLNEVNSLIGSEISRINLISASVTAIMADLSAIEAEIITINASLPTITGDLAALTVRVTAAEAAILALAARVTAVEVFTADMRTTPLAQGAGSALVHAAFP